MAGFLNRVIISSISQKEVGLIITKLPHKK
jgi:hypothetical protein